MILVLMRQWNTDLKNRNWQLTVTDNVITQKPHKCTKCGKKNSTKGNLTLHNPIDMNQSEKINHIFHIEQSNQCDSSLRNRLL